MNFLEGLGEPSPMQQRRSAHSASVFTNAARGRACAHPERLASVPQNGSLTAERSARTVKVHNTLWGYVHMPVLQLPEQQSLLLRQTAPRFAQRHVPLLQVPEQQSLLVRQVDPGLAHPHVPLLQLLEQQSPLL